MKKTEYEKIDISQINYKEPLAKYIDLAYRTLKKSDAKLPKESRMRVPLTVMFIVHNRDVFGYTTIRAFEKVVSEIANISVTSARNRVLGGYIGTEYAGLRYIFYKFMHYRDRQTVSVMWFNSSKLWRYGYILDTERMLANLMEEEAQKNFEDFSALRIKVQSDDIQEEAEEE